MFGFFLSSGLFLGWSLGANDASNVFGTAVGTGMIRFRTAAICCAVFIILGAVIGGAGTSATLGKLGEINAIAGAFVVALAAGAGVYLMTKVGYPVSTSQTIVGAIIGWNVFSGSLTDYHSLTQIVSTWVACPILSAAIAILLYKLVSRSILVFKPHMFHLDALTRYGLLVVGAFGSYSLGANNIANVMGVFVPLAPFPEISLFGWLVLSPAQQLFFIGGLAIASGVLTYSRHVMMIVGEGIMRLSPVAAFVVESAHSLVLFLFSSEGINQWLTGYGLPAIPLVPVSSSQAIVGAVIGIGLLKGGRAVQWRVLRGISIGWVVTPLIAGVISFIALFFFQNVFNQQTYRQVSYSLTPQALDRIGNADLNTALVSDMANEAYLDAVTFRRALDTRIHLTWEQKNFVMESAKVDALTISKEKIESVTADGSFSEAQVDALRVLEGRTFVHPWLLYETLGRLSPEWRMAAGGEESNRKIVGQYAYLYRLFRD